MWICDSLTISDFLLCYTSCIDVFSKNDINRKNNFKSFFDTQNQYFSNDDSTPFKAAAINSRMVLEILYLCSVKFRRH